MDAVAVLIDLERDTKPTTRGGTNLVSEVDAGTIDRADGRCARQWDRPGRASVLPSALALGRSETGPYAIAAVLSAPAA